jgi:hypothetical protein
MAFRRFVTFVFILGAALPSRSAGQAQDTFPKDPFNGMQIVYGFSGVSVDGVEDTHGNRTMRSVSGAVTSGRVTATITTRMSSGFGADVRISYPKADQSGEQEDEFYLPNDRAGGSEKTVNLDIPAGKYGVSITVIITGRYSMGTGRSLWLIASFAAPRAPIPPKPPESAPPKKDKPFKFLGLVTDAQGKPMSHVWLAIKANGVEKTVPVAEDGRYEHTVDLPDPLPESAREVRFKVLLANRRKGRERYRIAHYQTPDVPATAVLKVQIDPESGELRQDLAFGAAGDFKTNLGDFNRFQRYSVLYRWHSEALVFAEDRLKVDFRSNEPYLVLAEHAEPTAFDYPRSARIGAEHVLTNDVSVYACYHEFGHYVQYTARGGKWLVGQGAEGDRTNRAHGGYANADTADSFVEGFATFFAALVQAYRKDPAPDPAVVGAWGSLADRWRTWEGEGRHEEFAFASLFWDFVRTSGAAVERVCRVLGDSRIETLWMAYEALKREFPDKARDLDALCIRHGIYALELEGNHAYDEGEAFLDLPSGDQPGDLKLGPGETWVDYSVKDGKLFMDYIPGAVIGQSANYARRETRFSTFRFPNAFLKIDGGAPERLRVRIAYADGSRGYEYVAPVFGGRLQMSMLPDTAEAAVRVLAETEVRDEAALYVTTTSDLREKFRATRDAEALDILVLPPGTFPPPPEIPAVDATGDPADFEVPADVADVSAGPEAAASGEATAGAGWAGPTAYPGKGGGSTGLVVAAIAGLVVLSAVMIAVLRRRRSAGPTIGRRGAALAITLPDGRRLVYPIQKPRTTIGRNPAADCVLPDPEVSVDHAEILAGPNGLTLRDTRSSNGTFVNGARIGEAPLYLGDEILVGRTRIVLRDEGQSR